VRKVLAKSTALEGDKEVKRFGIPKGVYAGSITFGGHRCKFGHGKAVP
jgi:hypothetical protein